MLEAEVLEALGKADWLVAEEAALALLREGRFREGRASAVTAILVAQARILGKLDPRGAFLALLPAVSEIGSLDLGRAWTARAHVVSAIVFAAPGSLLSGGRTDASLEVARRLLDDHQHEHSGDLRALAALATLGAGVAPPSRELVHRHYEAAADDLRGATAPVTRILSGEVHAVVAGLASDLVAERNAIEDALALSRTIGFAAAEARLSVALAERSGKAEGRRLAAMARAVLERAGIDAPWLIGRIHAVERGDAG